MRLYWDRISGPQWNHGDFSILILMLPSSIKHYNHRYTSQSSFLVLKIGTLVVWLVVNLSAKRHALLINTTPKSFTIKSTYSIRILDFSIVSCLIRSWTFHIVRCKLLFIGFIFYIVRLIFNMMGSILDFSLVPRWFVLGLFIFGLHFLDFSFLDYSFLEFP